MRAGRHQFADLGTSAQEFLDQALAVGCLRLPEVEIQFSPPATGYSTYAIDLHPDGLEQGNRLRMLTISGTRALDAVNNTAVDWELKSGRQPYDSLGDLANVYGIGLPGGSDSKIELIAYQTTAVDATQSHISGTKAHLFQVLLKGFDPKKTSLGYIVYRNGGPVERGSFSGAEMSWNEDDKFQKGAAILPVEPGSVVKCFASYAGVAHHERWVVDPALAQNIRRTSYETFDLGLAGLKEILQRPYVKGRDAREVEAGIAWILWMLGFSPIHLGAVGKTQTAPDLIVAAPSGKLAVVECTTGLLKAENKLAQLVERGSVLKKRLAAAGAGSTPVLYLMITTKSKDEVSAELDQATQAGVLVATKEDIERAIARTQIPVNPDEMYEQALVALQKANSKLGMRSPSPF